VQEGGGLSVVLAGRSPCGRTSIRSKGRLARADQTTKVKARQLAE